jgi:hypothetical protein
MNREQTGHASRSDSQRGCVQELPSIGIDEVDA